MVRVAPSILAADFANLERDCLRVLDQDHRMLHFDVMDGVFVPNLSVGVPVLASLAKALPSAEFDVHLMIIRPDKFVEEFARAGAGMITIHLEAESAPRETVRAIRSLGCRAGISLRPGTPVQDLFGLLEEVDHVLVMSVEPGFGGQSFMPGAVQRIEQLRAEADRQRLPLLIEAAGGVTAATAPLCIAAGADILVAGSSVFGAADPAAEMRRLQSGSWPGGRAL